jgi:hypothetical protein
MCRLQYRAAIELIKPFQPQQSSSPEARDLTELLAAGYLGDNNAFWAIRTLGPRLDADPNDCGLRVWLAWAHFQVAELDRAREILDHASCHQPSPQSARASLLRALMAKTEGKNQVAAADLVGAWAAEEMYATDRDALSTLAQRIDPNQIPEFSWKLDSRQGFTSNALLGSPTDPNASQSISDTKSGFYQLSGWFRLSPEWHLPVRPSLEGEVRTLQLNNPEISAQSYISLTGRLGVFVGSRLPRLFVAWRPEYLRLAGGALDTTGPNWYVADRPRRARTASKSNTPWPNGRRPCCPEVLVFPRSSTRRRARAPSMRPSRWWPTPAPAVRCARKSFRGCTRR